MAELQLKFQTNLQDYSAGPQLPGLLFHRWLPNGEKDSIILKTEDPKTTIKIWFERTGYTRGGLIHYDPTRHEVNDHLVSEQAVLELGSANGILSIDISSDEVKALSENKRGDPIYMKLGRRLVRLLYPPLATFLKICQTNFGQYWISGLAEWDTRQGSLGLYCQRLSLQWRIGDGVWNDFLPDQPVQLVTPKVGGPSDSQRYLSKESWDELIKATKNGYDPSVAATTLAVAHEFMDQGNLRQAFIEGVSALEVALETFFNERLDKKLQGTMAEFNKINLPARTIAAVTLLKEKQTVDLDTIIEAISMRNKVVHDGWDPIADIDAKKKLEVLLTAASLFISGPRFRFPSAHYAVTKMPESEWGKLEGKSKA